MRRKAPVYGWRVQRLEAEKWRTCALVQRAKTPNEICITYSNSSYVGNSTLTSLDVLLSDHKPIAEDSKTACRG